MIWESFTFQSLKFENLEFKFGETLLDDVNLASHLEMPFFTLPLKKMKKTNLKVPLRTIFKHTPLFTLSYGQDVTANHDWS